MQSAILTSIGLVTSFLWQADVLITEKLEPCRKVNDLSCKWADGTIDTLTYKCECDFKLIRCQTQLDLFMVAILQISQQYVNTALQEYYSSLCLNPFHHNSLGDTFLLYTQLTFVFQNKLILPPAGFEGNMKLCNSRARISFL